MSLMRPIWTNVKLDHYWMDSSTDLLYTLATAAAVLLHLLVLGACPPLGELFFFCVLQQLTASLLAVAFLTSFGSSMLYGYNLAVVNSPAGVCLEF